MKVITSKENVEYKRAMSLRQKKYRQRYRCFLLEGIRSLRSALERNIAPCEVWLTEASLCKYSDVLSGVDERVVRVISDDLLLHLSQTKEPQGIVAVFSVAVLPDQVEMLAQDTIVVLDRVQDPGNAGTIIRLAAASGCKAVWSTEGSVDLFNAKTIRSSMGSLFQIPVRDNVSMSEIMTLSQAENRKIYAATLRHSLPYMDMVPSERVFWVFGNEGNGLADEVVRHAHQCYHIPLQNGVESLNVAMAASVLLFCYRAMCGNK